MKYFITYNPETGDITRSGSCLEEDFGTDLGDNSVWLEVVGSSSKGYVLNNEYIEYTETQLLLKNNRPNYWSEWSNATMSWIDPRDLAQKQEAKWEEIKQIRSQKEFSPFTWDSSEFDADSESQRRIQGAAQLAMIAAGASQSFSIDWTLADNTVHTLSGADMISVGLALGTHVATQYEIARTLRTAIEATTTEEELNAITWPT